MIFTKLLRFGRLSLAARMGETQGLVSFALSRMQRERFPVLFSWLD